MINTWGVTDNPSEVNYNIKGLGGVHPTTIIMSNQSISIIATDHKRGNLSSYHLSIISSLEFLLKVSFTSTPFHTLARGTPVWLHMQKKIPKLCCQRGSPKPSIFPKSYFCPITNYPPITKLQRLSCPQDISPENRRL